MIKTILIIFILLWLLGFIHIGFLLFPLFVIFGHAFTLQTLFYLIIIASLINFLPGIFRTIAIILFVLWLFSTFGFFIAGLSNILLLILIIAVLFSLF